MLSGDLIGLATPAVKATYDVQHAHDLPLALRRAFALSVRPPAGPVFLSVPMDVLGEDTEVEVPARTPAPAPATAAGLERAALLLGAAARPAIVAGDGVGREDALGALVRTAEVCGAVVHHQPMADCLNFPTTHPLYAGMLPPRHDAIRAALAAYDTVLIVGAHAFTPHHYSPGPALPPGLTVVQLDSDPHEIGRNFPATAGCVGALAPSLHRLAEMLRDRVPAHTAKARILRAGERHTADRDRAESAARAAYSPAPLAPGPPPTPWPAVCRRTPWSLKRPSPSACCFAAWSASNAPAATRTPSAAAWAGASAPPSVARSPNPAGRWSPSSATAAPCSACRDCGAPRDSTPPSYSS